MSTKALITSIVALLILACGPNLPSDSDELATPQDMSPETDLPSETDLACETLECYTWYEGTQWEAGGCVDGECGPGWSACRSVETGLTCDEVCSTYYETTCVPGGCAGLGGVTIDSHWFLSDCGLNNYEPVSTMIECDEPLIPFEDNEVFRQVQCCCAEID